LNFDFKTALTIQLRIITAINITHIPVVVISRNILVFYYSTKALPKNFMDIFLVILSVKHGYL